MLNTRMTMRIGHIAELLAIATDLSACAASDSPELAEVRPQSQTNINSTAPSETGTSPAVVATPTVDSGNPKATTSPSAIDRPTNSSNSPSPSSLTTTRSDSGLQADERGVTGTAPACKALLGGKSLPETAVEVLQDVPLTSAQLKSWLNERHVGLSAPAAAYPGLSNLVDNEVDRVCTYALSSPMSPPGPPAEDGAERPPADSLRVIVRPSGDVVVDAIGPRESVLSDAPPR